MRALLLAVVAASARTTSAEVSQTQVSRARGLASTVRTWARPQYPAPTTAIRVDEVEIIPLRLRAS